MQRISAILLLATFSCAWAIAAEWSGKLVDADCTHRNGGPRACEPGLNTTAFGLVVAGKAYLFDKGGSQKASAAMRRRAEMHAADPNYPYSPEVGASVTGERQGNKIVVKSIDIQ